MKSCKDMWQTLVILHVGSSNAGIKDVDKLNPRVFWWIEININLLFLGDEDFAEPFESLKTMPLLPSPVRDLPSDCCLG